METLSAAAGRDWDVLPDPGHIIRAGREWVRRRHPVEPSTLGREWLRSSTALEPRPALVRTPTSSSTKTGRPPQGSKRFLAAIAVLGLGALAFAVDRSDDSAPVVGSVPFEQYVDAAELEPGSLYHLVDQIGARQMWEAGYTGAGVNVAVVDTGVAQVDSLDADGKLVAVVDLTGEANDPTTRYVDTNGHGTFMAGIIAGNESGLAATDAVDAPQEFKGVAPDAGIVSVKVAGRDGATNPNDVIAGVNWVVDNADELDIGVLNLSFSSGSELPYQEDALTAALERAWQAGIVVVTPAGNDGPDAARLASPAIDPHFIAVGGARALDDGFEIAEWSSSGDGVRNPDVTAPGAHIQSLRAPNSDADVNHPEGFVDDETFLGSGTSESAAVVSAAAALLLEAHPEWTNDQVKSALVNSAMPIDGVSDSLQGSGMIRVDAAASSTALSKPNTWPTASALTADVSATPSSGFVSVFTGTHWTGTQWTGTHWTGTHWTGTHWTGTHWTGTHWTGTHWTGTQWTGTQWTGTQWTGTHWTGTQWTGTHWTGTQWTGTQWTGTQWTGTQWTGTQWTGTQWTGTQWTGTQWTGTQWTGTHWTGTQWTGTQWTGTQWTGTHWTGTHWT